MDVDEPEEPEGPADGDSPTPTPSSSCLSLTSQPLAIQSRSASQTRGHGTRTPDDPQLDEDTLRQMLLSTSPKPPVKFISREITQNSELIVAARKELDQNQQSRISNSHGGAAGMPEVVQRVGGSVG